MDGNQQSSPFFHIAILRTCFILGGTDEIQVVLDDSQVNIATIASSRHVGPIKPKVDEWLRLLNLFSQTLVSSFSIFLILIDSCRSYKASVIKVIVIQINMSEPFSNLSDILCEQIK